MDTLSDQSHKVWDRCASMRRTLQAKARRIVSSSLFSNFFLGCIILNTLLLTLEHDGMPERMEFILALANVVLTMLFVVELLLKLIGLGWREYSADKFNIFDAIIVLFALIELAFQFIGGSNE